MGKNGIKRIMVLMVPVGGEPRRAEIKDGCDGWQEALGGRSFDMVGVGPGVFIVCADDYHGLEDRPNGCGLYGPYFFVKVDANGHSRSLTEAQLEKCRRYWEARRPADARRDRRLGEGLRFHPRVARARRLRAGSTPGGRGQAAVLGIAVTA